MSDITDALLEMKKKLDEINRDIDKMIENCEKVEDITYRDVFEEDSEDKND